MIVSYSTEQNAISERENITVTKMTKIMLKDNGLSYKFWVKAIYLTVYLLNRCPAKAVQNKMPIKPWSSQKPLIKHLRVFDYICYVNIPKEKRSKLEVKIEIVIFPSYSFESKDLKDYSFKKYVYIYISLLVRMQNLMKIQFGNGMKKKLRRK